MVPNVSRQVDECSDAVVAYGSPANENIVIDGGERIATVGKGGGLLLAPTHVLEPDVPWENVVAFFEAIDACAKK